MSPVSLPNIRFPENHLINMCVCVCVCVLISCIFVYGCKMCDRCKLLFTFPVLSQLLVPIMHLTLTYMFYPIAVVAVHACQGSRVWPVQTSSLLAALQHVPWTVVTMGASTLTNVNVSVMKATVEKAAQVSWCPALPQTPPPAAVTTFWKVPRDTVCHIVLWLWVMWQLPDRFMIWWISLHVVMRLSGSAMWLVGWFRFYKSEAVTWWKSLQVWKEICQMQGNFHSPFQKDIRIRYHATGICRISIMKLFQWYTLAIHFLWRNLHVILPAFHMYCLHL